MGVLNSLRQGVEAIGTGLEGRVENPSVPLTPANIEKWFGGTQTYAGKHVSPENALGGLVAVYACVRIRAETVGSLPVDLMKRKNDYERDIVSEKRDRYPGSLARILHQQPNPEMTAQDLWELASTHVDIRGNAYFNVERGGDGRPKALWPLRPDLMAVRRVRKGEDVPGAVTNEKIYDYRLPSGQPVILRQNEVLHVRGFGPDPMVGLSPIGVARQAIGIAMAAEEYGGRFFSNSGIPSGVLIDPRPLKKEQVEERRKAWQDAVGGLTNANRLAVLHSGMDYKAIGLSHADAQFLETRKFELQEIARLWRIPLHLLQDTERSTSWGTGIEQQTIGYVIYTVTPITTRLEGSINRDLGLDVGRTLRDEGLYPQFRIQALLRGDAKTRAEFYAKGLQWGWLTPRDVRALEDLPFIDGLDQPLRPKTHAPVDESGKSVGDPNDPADPIRSAYEAHLAALNGHR